LDLPESSLSEASEETINEESLFEFEMVSKVK